MFNLSIMITTWIAGVLLVNYGAMSLIWYAIILAVPGVIISYFAKHTLRPMG
jgi:predicted MFS family arabinose efflux permease